MTVKIYNKLVRDRIPEIIKSEGYKIYHRILEDEAHLQALNAKLYEEVAEFEQDQSIEELADILEIIFALTHHLGSSLDELEATRLEKLRNRGGFEKRIFLVKVEEK